MPSDFMDHRHLSSFYMPSVPSSFFSEEIRFPSEGQVGFRKTDSMSDPCGMEMSMSRSKPVSSSLLEKLRPVGGNSVDCIEVPQPYYFKEQKTTLSIGHHLTGTDSTANLSMTSWRSPDQDLGSRSTLYVQPPSLSVEGNKVGMNGVHYENGLFSSSLSEILNKKLRLSPNNFSVGQSVGTTKLNLGEDEVFDSSEEIEAQTIGDLLPDDDDLLSGVIDDLEHIARPNSASDVEDDIFCSGGGMELEANNNFNCNIASDFDGGGASHCQDNKLFTPFVGGCPDGELPSRTLIVRNINSNVQDAELRAVFKQYGDIRTLYTVCKSRGFVMVTFYDIRAAQNAMRATQNKKFGSRKLDLLFFTPKENLSVKDINQGTIVLNLDSSVSNDDIHQIFSVYGDIREIYDSPHKVHQKFVEFYDVRAAEAALHALNKHDIAGKKTSHELSHPGGARWSSTKQLSLELEEEESNRCRLGTHANNSSSEYLGSMKLGVNTSHGLDNGVPHALHSAFQVPVSSVMENTSNGISSSVFPSLSSSLRAATVGNHVNQSGHSLGQMNFGFHGGPTFHPHSLPEFHEGVMSGIPLNSPSTMSAMTMNINSRLADGMDNRHIHRVGSVGLSSHSFEHNEVAFGVSGSGSCPLHGHHIVWNNSNTYNHHPSGSMIWQNSPSLINNFAAHPPSQMHGLPRVPSHMLNTVLPLHHHVGSAPAVNPSLWDMQRTHPGDCMEAAALHPGSLGSMGFSGGSPMHQLELASHSVFTHNSGNHIDPSIPSIHVGLPSPQQRCHMLHGRNNMIPMPASYDAPSDRIRNRRSDSSVNQADNKKQYELDIDRIVCGEDSRTTLMIKNIPNKYTSKMLLAAIDEQHRGTYDFIYLPIDFKNKCNVGYAFINMIDPQHIVPFYQAFNGKKWEKFNSEKVASLAYARIQGKAALVAHFQNSSLMNEDKRCRPILFHSDGPNAGDQEPFPVGVNIRSRRSRTAAAATTEENHHQGSPSGSANGEESSNTADSSSGSTKDSE